MKSAPQYPAWMDCYMVRAEKSLSSKAIAGGCQHRVALAFDFIPCDPMPSDFWTLRDWHVFSRRLLAESAACAIRAPRFPHLAPWYLALNYARPYAWYLELFDFRQSKSARGSSSAYSWDRKWSPLHGVFASLLAIVFGRKSLTLFRPI